MLSSHDVAQNDIRDALNSLSYEDLARIHLIVACRYDWLAKRGGLSTEDLVQESIKRLLTGERTWNPKKSFKNQIIDIAFSIASHSAEKVKRAQNRLKYENKAKEFLEDKFFVAMESHDLIQRYSSSLETEMEKKLFYLILQEESLSEIAVKLKITVAKAFRMKLALRHDFRKFAGLYGDNEYAEI